MMSKFLSILLIWVCTLLPLKLTAGETHYYFYHPEISYGSEYYSTPFSLLLNGGYDILRNGSHQNNGETNNIFHLDYRQGFRNVWDNISSPAYHISRYGWNRFLTEEVIPTSLSQDKGQWIPNYGHHILGSGMLYVRMAEWYDYHGYPHPYWLSFLTTTTYQFLNEALENNHANTTNVDPIADLLIFNPLGFIVFSFESVRRFFSETVPMYDWSLQPVFDPRHHVLENAGLQFVFTYPLPFSEQYSLFFYYGIYGIGGITYSYNKEYNFSIGAGTVVNRLEEHVLHNSRTVTGITDGAIGFFYDHNHSLMTALLITGPRLYNARLNIYPGFIRWGSFQPGMYLAFGEWDGFRMGLSLARVPLGISYGTLIRRK